MASKNEIAVKVFGVNYETIVRRILATFDQATPSDIEAGATWYDEAHDIAADLAGRHGLSLEQSASVIAALSPRTTWARNIAGAVLFIESIEILPGLIGTNVARARTALVDGYNGLGQGPKVASFARNIAGDHESVTVDVWACRVADLDETLLSRKGAYQMVADAYRAAARRRGVNPATMQATTWVVARSGRAA
jgi:hypothetical protein